MSRVEFLNQLEVLLQNIAPAEREEALQYYNDYFDDAGPENEKSVIEALGTPAKVAENIKRDLYSNGYGDSMYQRTTPVGKEVTPYGQGNTKDTNEHPNEQTGYDAYGNPQSNANQAASGDGKSKEKLSNGMIVLIVILCVLASPAIIGAATGLLGALVGIIAAWFGAIFGFGVAAIALFIVFIVLVVLGIICIFAEPLVGVGLIGCGMLCGGLGILFMMLTVALAGIVTPSLYKGIAQSVKKLINKVKGN